MNKTLKIPSISDISKGTGLRMIHAKFEKDPMRNCRVIQVLRGLIKKQEDTKTKLAMP